MTHISESSTDRMEIRDIEERMALCIRDVTTPETIGETIGKILPEFFLATELKIIRN